MSFVGASPALRVISDCRSCRRAAGGKRPERPCARPDGASRGLRAPGALASAAAERVPRTLAGRQGPVLSRRLADRHRQARLPQLRSPPRPRGHQRHHPHRRARRPRRRERLGQEHPRADPRRARRCPTPARSRTAAAPRSPYLDAGAALHLPVRARRDAVLAGLGAWSEARARHLAASEALESADRPRADRAPHRRAERRGGRDRSPRRLGPGQRGRGPPQRLGIPDPEAPVEQI